MERCWEEKLIILPISPPPHSKTKNRLGEQSFKERKQKFRIGQNLSATLLFFPFLLVKLYNVIYSGANFIL